MIHEKNPKQKILLRCPFKYLNSYLLSPETGFLHFRSCVVKTSFGHIPSIEHKQKRRILVSIVNFYTFALLNGQELVLLRRVFLLLS